jgi:hypothetical protein
MTQMTQIRRAKEKVRSSIVLICVICDICGFKLSVDKHEHSRE